MKRLEKKVAIITGAGRGIGKAAALLFAKEGAKVVVADILKKEGEETVKSIKKAGGEAMFIQTDVSNAKQVENMIKTTVEKYKKLDILYQNAGILGKQPCPTTELPVKEWDRFFAVNVKGIFLGAKYAIPYMKKQGGGVIINMGSDGGKFAFAEWQAYCTTKAAVIHLTKALALEVGGDNIRVVSICPAATMTPMLLGLVTPKEKEKWRTFISQRIAINRAAKPEEIANAALWLASDEASFVTGAAISVDGGTTSAGPGALR